MNEWTMNKVEMPEYALLFLFFHNKFFMSLFSLCPSRLSFFTFGFAFAFLLLSFSIAVSQCDDATEGLTKSKWSSLSLLKYYFIVCVNWYRFTLQYRLVPFTMNIRIQCFGQVKWCKLQIRSTRWRHSRSVIELMLCKCSNNGRGEKRRNRVESERRRGRTVFGTI